MVHTIQSIPKQAVIAMLTTSFADSTRILGMLRTAQKKHLYNFFNYIYTSVEQFGQIFVSENHSTVLLYFYSSRLKFNLKTGWLALRLMLVSLSWRNLFHTLRLNSEIKATRNAAAMAHGHDDYLYVWFLAGKELSRSYSGLYEAMAHLKIESQLSGVPIYIETVVPRMVAIYERAGFECYAEKDCGQQIVWFGKYENH